MRPTSNATLRQNCEPRFNSASPALQTSCMYVKNDLARDRRLPVCGFDSGSSTHTSVPSVFTTEERSPNAKVPKANTAHS